MSRIGAGLVALGALLGALVSAMRGSACLVETQGASRAAACVSGHTQRPPALTCKHVIVLRHAEGLVLDVNAVLPVLEALPQVLQLSLRYLKEAHLKHQRPGANSNQCISIGGHRAFHIC
eukprot:GHRQ01039213.1.p2 GENE.GHRQ01039213.1~~GHRQ01039213.1.p2  ORF type:complete len:120 (+),score=1.93 GHRQ01039213.1:254-613(+)